MEEIWKDVPGYEGLYQVSNFGRVRSFLIGGRKKKNSDFFDKISDAPKILSTRRREGYIGVCITKECVRRHTHVHRLVAETFIPNPDGYKEVNHIDGNKQNNSVENLEWCSSSYNVRHSIKMHPEQLNGIMRFNKIEKTVPVFQISKDGEIIGRFSSGAEASRKTGICGRNIMQVANHTPFKPGHERKTAGGYIWRFESEVINK